MEAFSFYYESVSREFHSSRNMLSTASLRSFIILQSGAGLIYFNKNNRANLCGEKKSTMKHPGVSKLKVARLDFLGGYLPSLSINCVAMIKDMEKRLPQLYYIKMKFLMIWVLSQSESPWQLNDAIKFFIYLCVSLYQEVFLRNRLREYVPAIIVSIIAKFEQIL